MPGIAESRFGALHIDQQPAPVDQRKNRQGGSQPTVPYRAADHTCNRVTYVPLVDTHVAALAPAIGPADSHCRKTDAAQSDGTDCGPGTSDAVGLA